MNPLSTIGLTIAGCFLIAVIGIIGYEAYTIHSLRGQLTLVSNDNAACLATNVTWKATVDQQKKYIDNQEEQIKIRELAAKVKIDAAETVRDDATKRANKILAMKVDPNDCVAAQSVLKSYLQGRVK